MQDNPLLYHPSSQLTALALDGTMKMHSIVRQYSSIEYEAHRHAYIFIYKVGPNYNQFHGGDKVCRERPCLGAAKCNALVMCGAFFVPAGSMLGMAPSLST